MLSGITKFFADRREKAAAVDAAIRRFESAPDHLAHRGISSVIHSDQFGFVVRVCYGQVIPPGRAWFRVLRGSTDVQELSFDEVTQYGENYWR